MAIRLEKEISEHKPVCPYLSVIEEKRIVCANDNCIEQGVREYGSKSDCKNKADTHCYDRFCDCVYYRKYYTQENEKSCIKCCNNSWYTGLDPDQDGQEYCFCQLKQKPMLHKDFCDMYNRHPDLKLDEPEQKAEQSYPYVVGQLLKKETDDVVYSVIIKNMRDNELKVTLDAEKRPEGLRMVKAEAIGRGMIEPESEPTAAGAQMVPTGLLYPNPNNPRKRFDQDELDKLTASVKQLGVLSPILVVQDGEQYRIVAGERRYRAAMAAGLDKVPVLVRELTPEQEFEIMLTENIQRKDLDPIEEAQAFQTAVDKGWKQTELAERLGISQAQVANRLRLLKLPESIQENISRGIIPPSAGRELLSSQGVTVDPEIAEKIAKEITEDGLPVKRVADKVAIEMYYATKPLDNENTYQQSYAVLFDTELCNDCPEKVLLKLPQAEKACPRCQNPKCWDKKQKEAKQLRSEAEEKELLEKFPDALVIDDDNDNRVNIYNSTLSKYCQSKECEFFKVARQKGFSWTREICLNPEMYNSCLDAIKQQKKQVEEEEKKTFSEEKNAFFNGFALLTSRDEAIFMIMQVLELISYTCTTENLKKLVCKQIEIPSDKIENKVDEELLELVANTLKSIPVEKGVGYLYKILFGVLLDTVDGDRDIWKLTLGAENEPKQESEAS